MDRIEVIAAVRNEEEALHSFVARIDALALPDDVRLNLVFVEDSSEDDTRRVLRELAGRDERVGFYSLAVGFGQGPAIAFALQRSRADAVVMMDADGSHPVELIPEMIRLYRGGARVVQGVRETLSHRPWYRDLGSAVWNAAFRALAGVDVGRQRSYYRLVAAEVGAELARQPRFWRYLRFPLPRSPLLATLPFDAHERRHGSSEYGPLRLVGFALDGYLSLVTPPRLAALLVAILGGATALALAGSWPLALVALLAAAGLVGRRASLRRSDVLARMEIRESANVPLALDAA